MKSFVVSLSTCCALLMSLAAAAEVAVEDISIKQSAPSAEGTNIRVTLQNGAGLQRLTGVELQARQTDAEPWQTVKVWKRKVGLQSGKRLALDWLPSGSDAFPEILTKEQFQVRARAYSGPRLLATSEKDYAANYTALRMMK